MGEATTGIKKLIPRPESRTVFVVVQISRNIKEQRTVAVCRRIKPLLQNLLSEIRANHAKASIALLRNLCRCIIYTSDNPYHVQIKTKQNQ